MKTKLSAITLCLTLSCLGCDSDDASDGAGSASFAAYGESFIEEGIPAAEVEDGWEIHFDRFLIVIGPVSVNDSHNGIGVESEMLARLFYPEGAGRRSSLEGTTSLVSIERARALIGYEPQYSLLGPRPTVGVS